MSSTVLANATDESQMPSQLSDAALGGIIGGAIAGLVLFLTVTVAAIYCIQSQRRRKLESPESSVDPFTYVRQVNKRDVNWTLPPGTPSTLLIDPPTLPTNNSFTPGHVGHTTSTTDRLIQPEVLNDDMGRASLSQPEAPVVVEKQMQTRNRNIALEEDILQASEPASETGLRVKLEPGAVSGTGLLIKELEPNAANGTGFLDSLEPMVICGTGLRNGLEPEDAETGLRDIYRRQSLSSLDPSFSEDYCNRVIDEAFLAIDNFAYSDCQSECE